MLVAWWSSVATFPSSSVGVAVWGGHGQVAQPPCRGGPVAVYTMPYSLYFAKSMTRRLALKGVVYIVC